MAKTEFDQFVARQQAEASETEDFNPEQQVKEWKEYLERLYSNVKEYMRPYVENGTAAITLSDIELNEEFSGPYMVRQLQLTIGRSIVAFKPIGTMLIGSKGRVDVLGPRGNARLTLMNKNITSARELIRVRVSVVGSSPARPPERKHQNEVIQWVWKIASPPPDIRFVDLTQQAFFDMVLSVADA